jgi:hypothetical protein
VHELVLVLSDYYVSQEAPDRELPAGVTLPGFQHVARFGTRSKLSSGWRPWLSRWVIGTDAGATATVAAASMQAAAPGPTSTAAPPDPTPTVAPGSMQAAALTGPTSTAVPSDLTPTVAHASMQAAALSRAMATGAPGSMRALPEHVLSGPTQNFAWMATPMHLIAGMTSVHVDRRSILRLDVADQTTLTADFQRVFHDSGFRLEPLEAGDFLMLGPEMPHAETREPARALGGSMDQHPDSSTALRRLGAEIEMWLHDHPINETRRRRGELPVTSFWLWGAGAIPTRAAVDATTPGLAAADQLPVAGAASRDAGGTPSEHVPALGARAGARRVSADHVGITRGRASGAPAIAVTAGGSTDAGDSSGAAVGGGNSRAADGARDSSDAVHGALAFGCDSYLQGLWATRGAKVAPLPQQLVDVFGYPHAQRAVLVIEIGLMLQSNPKWTFFDAVADIDRRFIAPAVQALNRGQYHRLVVLANDYELTLRARDRLKFWRRAPPGLSGLQ